VGKGVSAGLEVRALGAIGLAVALLLPLLAGGLLPLAITLGVGLLAGLAGLVLTLRSGAPRLAWPFAAVLLLYGCVGLARAHDASGVLATALFALGLGGLGLATAWLPAEEPAASLLATQGATREAWLLGATVTLTGAGLAGALTVVTGYAAAGVAAVLATLAGTAVAGRLRPGLAPLALPLAALAALLIAAWPTPAGVVRDLDQIVAAAGLGLIASTIGGATAAAPRAHVWGAVLAGFGPLAALVAVTPPGVASLAHPWWGAAGLMLAGLNLVAFACSPLRRRPIDREVFACAAAAALLAGLLWLGALAWAVPAAFAAWLTAAAGLRLQSAALRNGAGALAAAAGLAALLRLATSAEPLARAASAADAAFAAGLLWFAARILAAARAQQAERASESALVVLAVCALLHAGEGILPWLPAAEGERVLYQLGLHAAALLGAATVLALAPVSLLSATSRKWAEISLLAAAGLYMGFATLSVFNPWWGMRPADVPGWPLLNPLLAGYLAPGLAFSLYARLKRSQETMDLASAAAGVGAGLIGLWGLLEARRFLTGAALARNPEAMPLASLAGAGAAIALACAIVALLFGPPLRRESVRLAALWPKPRRPVDPNLAPPA